MKKLIATVSVCGLLSACATAPEDISASYVSPMQYQSYDCQQIGAEMGRIGDRVADLTGKQRAERKKDQAAFAVGMILFWPALFLMAGSDKKEELGRLKGEHDALHQAAIAKKCPGAMPA